jgi:hypothetical protein
MVWQVSAIDPMTDQAASAVLEAFDAAQDAGLSSVGCYRAGVLAWRHAHPDQQPKYAAQKAVAIILAAKVRLRVDDA